VGLAEARTAHAAAAQGLAGLQEQWYQLDKQVEEQEAEQQQLLVSMCTLRILRFAYPLPATAGEHVCNPHCGLC
jgi:hypothetical protein